jgi:hypothetical protein
MLRDEEEQFTGRREERRREKRRREERRSGKFESRISSSPSNSTLGPDFSASPTPG